MAYRVQALTHAWLLRAGARERGQGTVEYVALILLVAAVLAGVVAATRSQKFGATGIADAIVKQLKSALDNVK
jgi:hypothetical protein